MTPIVFAGPSLHGLDLSSLHGIDLAPPAGCGDILRAVRSGREIIGLIDGSFESGPAVWHKEILHALAAGCRIAGASSMGALRAAECEAFGMLGIGRIFADYRDGRRVADGDVALTHGPAELGYVPLSVALVDVEDGLGRLREAGMLSEDWVRTSRRAAGAMFFKDRTWDRVFAATGIATAEIGPLTARLDQSGPALKARDAQLLLDWAAQARPTRAIASHFASTHFFDQLQSRLGTQ